MKLIKAMLCSLGAITLIGTFVLLFATTTSLMIGTMFDLTPTEHELAFVVATVGFVFLVFTGIIYWANNTNEKDKT